MAAAHEIDESILDLLPLPARMFVEGMKNTPQGLVLADTARDAIVDALVDLARRGVGLKPSLECMLKLAASCEQNDGGSKLGPCVADIVNLLGPRLASLESDKARAARDATAKLGLAPRSIPTQTANADAMKPWQLRTSRGAN
jgi:hypothetical protein